MQLEASDIGSGEGKRIGEGTVDVNDPPVHFHHHYADGKLIEQVDQRLPFAIAGGLGRILPRIRVKLPFKRTAPQTDRTDMDRLIVDRNAQPTDGTGRKHLPALVAHGFGHMSAQRLHKARLGRADQANRLIVRTQDTTIGIGDDAAGRPFFK